MIENREKIIGYIILKNHFVSIFKMLDITAGKIVILIIPVTLEKDLRLILQYSRFLTKIDKNNSSWTSPPRTFGEISVC